MITGEIEDYRWPWVENKKDILSGEASMLANPGGTFMYTVWNQWEEEILPDGHELIFNSDIIFRRLMYLMDDDDPQIPPVASILYVNRTILSLATNDELVLVGSARGFGVNGEIEEVKWLVRPLGSTMDPVEVGTQRQLQMQAQQLVNQPGWAGQPGWAQFQFMAKDKGGRWSPGAEVHIWVVEQLYQAFLPVARNQ
jgi:hypothetical protein